MPIAVAFIMRQIFYFILHVLTGLLKTPAIFSHQLLQTDWHRFLSAEITCNNINYNEWGFIFKFK
jgi:predicted tellurium resistance membrane protein TerC